MEQKDKEFIGCLFMLGLAYFAPYGTNYFFLVIAAYLAALSYYHTKKGAK